MQTLAAILLSCGLMMAQDFTVGSKLAKLKVTDHGAMTAIDPSAAKATAVVFVSVQCPVSNAYNERMAALHKEYASKGVQFAFVNANSTESVEDIDAHAQKNGWSFKVYKDVDNMLADKLGAQVTPEVFLFDKQGTLVYHGRIDDSRELANVKTNDTRAAIDAVLGGQAIAAAQTKAFGCTIKRAKKVS